MRDPNAAEPQPAVAKYRDTARQAAAKTERHDPRMPRKGRLRPGLFILHTVQRSWPRSRKAAAATERHDLALMQPPLPEPASDEHSLTLAVLVHSATNVYPELCTLGFLQPSGLLAAFRSAYGKLEFSTTSFVPCQHFLHCCGRNCPVAPHNKFCVRPHFTPPDSVNQGRQVFTPTSPFAGSTELCGREGKSHIFGHAATTTHGLCRSYTCNRSLC